MSRNNDTSSTNADTLQLSDESQAKTLATSSPASDPVTDPPQCTDDSLAGTQAAPDSESDLIRRADEPPPSEATKSSEPLQPRATPEPASTINRANWPEWLSEKYDHYAGLKFGNKWKECIIFWTELEHAFEFYNPVHHIILSFL
jgi:hypothetical protein